MVRVRVRVTRILLWYRYLHFRVVCHEIHSASGAFLPHLVRQSTGDATHTREVLRRPSWKTLSPPSSSRGIHRQRSRCCLVRKTERKKYVPVRKKEIPVRKKEIPVRKKERQKYKPATLNTAWMLRYLCSRKVYK